MRNPPKFVMEFESLILAWAVPTCSAVPKEQMKNVKEERLG